MNQYDLKALTWDNDKAKVERAEKVADVIKRILPLSQQMNALEYGCGTGLLSFCLAKFLKSITMADSSEGMLSVLSEKIKKFEISNMFPINLDLTKQDCGTQTYDLIYTLMTLHHICDMEGILDVFYKILNINGYLCVADLDREDGSFHGKGFNGHNGFEKNTLEEKLKMAGFNIVHYEICFEVAKWFEGNCCKKYPLFIIIVQKK
jgi:ubiquinone/menaquinone biosynthesis C-methylase UbiE